MLYYYNCCVYYFLLLSSVKPNKVYNLISISFVFNFKINSMLCKLHPHLTL